MPKTIDVYVLEQKIGSGQFGDVYKGYSKVDGMEVAIKTLQRAKIKGKFNDLLQNEIKVLKSCKNNNIIRLIDLKKTANNIYLMLEYCNEGDLNAYLKSRKRLPQDEALEYFVQILHAFETLVKNKIMHRDFKLANVLRHEGIIKVADFGFAKLLANENDHTQTILGSPLNMAPQIMNEQAYNSKADIWSIGVAFYELVYGKVPFSAMNMIELLQKIKREPLSFPFKTHSLIEDVLTRMLTVDPLKRIEWQDLFTHPVTTLLETHLQAQLNQSILCDHKQIPFNLSKFYLKTNKVIQHVNDIKTRKQLNQFLKTAIENTEIVNKYQGTIIKRTTERANKENNILCGKRKQSEDQINIETDTFLNLKTQFEIKCQKEGLSQKVQQEIRNNFAIILHHRNVYAFQGHIAQDLIQQNINSYSECLAFLMLKKAMTSLMNLKLSICKKSLQGIKHWQLLALRPEYQEIYAFIISEEEVFHKFNEKITMRVLQGGILSQFEEDLMISGKFSQEETNQRIYQRVLSSYLKKIPQNKNNTNIIHLIKIFQSQEIQKSLPGYNFSSYYQWFTIAEQIELMKRYQQLVSKSHLMNIN